MTDSIMPYAYFRTLLPLLAAERLGAIIFYEQKANLSLPHILALHRAGITSIQPGIESLSSRLLTLMDKGVQARQNLMLLRFARAADVDVALISCLRVIIKTAVENHPGVGRVGWQDRIDSFTSLLVTLFLKPAPQPGARFVQEIRLNAKILISALR